MNIVVLLGNATAQPELRQTTGQKAIANFRLAISRPGSERADFFDVVCWERQAEIAHQHITKGRRIAVEGRLHQTTWESDGQRRSKVEVIAHRIRLLGAPQLRNVTPGPLSEEQDLLAEDQLAPIV